MEQSTMPTQSITIRGLEYVSHDSLTFGDYGGASSVGLANIRVLIEQNSDSVESVSMTFIDRFQRKPAMLCYLLDSEQIALDDITKDAPAILDAYGDFGSRQVWVRKDVAEQEEYGSRYRGLLEALDNYPLLDEEEDSRVEMEWEEEAWRDWLKSDLLRTIEDDEDYLDEYASILTDSDLFECYRHTMEETNTYPVAEYSNVYVDVDRIADAFRKAIEDRLIA
jgi:hypothetical protein